MNDLSREVGGALGIAVLGSIATAVYRGHLACPACPPASPTRRGPPSRSPPTSGGPVADQANSAFIDGFRIAFLIAAGAAVVAAIAVAALLPRRDAQPMRRRQRDQALGRDGRAAGRAGRPASISSGGATLRPRRTLDRHRRATSSHQAASDPLRSWPSCSSTPTTGSPSTPSSTPCGAIVRRPVRRRRWSRTCGGCGASSNPTGRHANRPACWSTRPAGTDCWSHPSRSIRCASPSSPTRSPT